MDNVPAFHTASNRKKNTLVYSKKPQGKTK